MINSPSTRSVPSAPANDIGTGALKLDWMPIRAGLVITVAAATCTIISTLTVLSIAARRDPLQYRGAATALADAMIADSSWLLPLLFGAVLAVLAVLVGQSFSDIPSIDADLNRRRLAVSSWILAGLGLANWTLCMLSLLGPSAASAHLWSITIATVLLTAAALWIGSFVFAPAEQQLRVLANTERDQFQRLRSLPAHNEIAHPWRRVLLIAVAAITLSTAAGVIAILVSAPGRALLIEGRWLLLLVPALGASIAGCLQAVLISVQRDSSVRPLFGEVNAMLFTAIAVFPVLVVVLRGHPTSAARLVLTTLLVAYLLPIVTAYLPRTFAHGRSFRGSLDGFRFRSIRRRIARTAQRRSRLEQLLLTANRGRPRHSR